MQQRRRHTEPLDAISGKKRYSLTLWCEYPDYPHPLCEIGSGGEGEYVVEQSAEWLVKVAPYVTWAARILKVAVPITSGAVRVGLAGMNIEDLKAKLALMEKCARALPGGELETDTGDLTPTGIAKRPVGSELREFHDLLQEHGKGRAWGGLRRVHTKSGDFLWLCPQHYDVYEPPLPVLP